MASYSMVDDEAKRALAVSMRPVTATMMSFTLFATA
jgi:hypothetical protein